MRPLSPLETRVLGVLIEKAHTVPDSYPLSLNSLTLGCNQKTAREPVMMASEGDVQAAVDALKLLSLAFEASGSRVTALRAQRRPGAGAAVAIGGAAGGADAARAADDVGAAQQRRDGCTALPISRRWKSFSRRARRAGRRQGRPAGREAAAGAPGSARGALGCNCCPGAIDTSALPVASDAETFVAAGELATMRLRLSRRMPGSSMIAALRSLVERLYAELGVART